MLMWGKGGVSARPLKQLGQGSAFFDEGEGATRDIGGDQASTSIRNARRSMSDSGIRFGLVNAQSSA